MRNAFLIVIAAGILIAFAINMTTYQVDFTERAVVATFGKVDEEVGVVTEPGLKFKWPAPVQTVTVYDQRARVLEISTVQAATSDDSSLVVDAFLTWSVSDPREFFRRFNRGADDPEGQYAAAEELLERRLRQALSEFSEFSLDDLFTTDEGGSGLPTLEDAIRERVQRLVADDAGGAAGITVGTAGVSRMVFPEAVSAQVIERMRAFRETDRERVRNEGEAEAETLTQEANANRRTILGFASAQAEAIRGRGDREAADYRRVTRVSPQLDVFLNEIELMRTGGLGRSMTLVLDVGDIAVRLLDDGYLDALRSLPSPAEPDADDVLVTEDLGLEAGGDE